MPPLIGGDSCVSKSFISICTSALTIVLPLLNTAVFIHVLFNMRCVNTEPPTLPVTSEMIAATTAYTVLTPAPDTVHVSVVVVLLSSAPPGPGTGCVVTSVDAVCCCARVTCAWCVINSIANNRIARCACMTWLVDISIFWNLPWKYNRYNEISNLNFTWLAIYPLRRNFAGTLFERLCNSPGPVTSHVHTELALGQCQHSMTSSDTVPVLMWRHSPSASP